MNFLDLEGLHAQAMRPKLDPALGDESRADRIQADQADSGDGVALMKLRAKARWKLSLHDTRLNPEVHEWVRTR
jgi:hypothetical protein